MKSTWSVRTGPCLVVTVVPSTRGRRSRCTPSRETSGPAPRSRPAILSISSRKTMAFDSTRAMASRTRAARSTSRPCSSFRRSSRASATDRRRGVLRLPKRPGSMSRSWVSRSSPPWADRTWKAAGAGSATSISTVRVSSCPARRSSRSLSRVERGGARGGAPAPARRAAARRAGGGRAGAPRRASAAWFADLLLALPSHHGDGALEEVADDGFDVAPHVAHLGELAGLHLQEGARAEAGQPPGELGLAHARGPDEQDVLGGDVGGHLRRQALAADAVAEGDGEGALGRRPAPPRGGRARPRSRGARGRPRRGAPRCGPGGGSPWRPRATPPRSRCSCRCRSRRR